MAINSVSYGPAFLNQSMLNLNNQLTILQSQLTTGKKSTSYAGMGVNEGFAIAARSQLANISAFTDTMGNINTNINVQRLSRHHTMFHMLCYICYLSWVFPFQS